jgi:hypothetical protein
MFAVNDAQNRSAKTAQTLMWKAKHAVFGVKRTHLQEWWMLLANGASMMGAKN